jgi:hypothetical protein
MPEAPARRDPALQAAALRYAAGDLTPSEAAAFEARLADDQDTREALAEAVRLSAAALGQEPPGPHRSFRAAVREKLAGWCPAWLARRAYRGHPLAWAGLGAAAVAACTVIGLALAGREPAPDPAGPTAVTPSAAPAPLAVAPEPRPAPDPDTAAHAARELDPAAAACGGDGATAGGRSVAEIWADLSTPEHVEKAHDEELRWRHKLREMSLVHPSRPTTTAATTDRDH